MADVADLTAVPHALARVARLRDALAATSVDMLVVGGGGGTRLGTRLLVNISDVCAIFEAAHSVGGLGSALALLETGAYHASLAAALKHAGHRVHLSRSPTPGLGLRLVFLSRAADAASSAAAEHGHAPDAYHLLGGLWWLRHWLGAFLAERYYPLGEPPRELVESLHERQRGTDADFVTVAAEHAAVWHALARAAPAAFPLRALCGDGPARKEWSAALQTDLARECRHAFGPRVHMMLHLG